MKEINSGIRFSLKKLSYPLCKHDPITEKAVERVLKSRRSVLLKNKMANPGKAVTH